MDLGLAGAISGAGEGASKALTMAQAQYGAASLQEARDQSDDLRQARLLEHQAGEGAATREAAGKEGDKNRASAEANTGMQITSNEAIHTQATEAQKQIAGEGNTTHKDIAKSTQDNALEIAKLSNAMHERVARMQRELQSKQFDKTFSAAKMTATTAAMKDLTDEMIHLSAEVNKPLADHTSPEYKAAVDLLRRAQQTHQVYQEQMAKMIQDVGPVQASPGLLEKVQGAAAPPATPKINMGPYGMAQTPGTVTVPPPSASEQDMMRKSIQP